MHTQDMKPQEAAPSEHYARDHLIAKAVIYVIYLSVGVLSIEFSQPYLGLFFGTAIWLFGINGAAYVVETVLGHEHSHSLL